MSAQKKTKTDLVHLRSLPAVELATSTGRVALVWPEIQARVPTGKASDMCEAVQAHGLAVGIRAMVNWDLGWEIRRLGWKLLPSGTVIISGGTYERLCVLVSLARAWRPDRWHR